MEIIKSKVITQISFEEAWEALSPATQVVLDHLYRAEIGGPPVLPELPAAHRQSS